MPVARPFSGRMTAQSSGNERGRFAGVAVDLFGLAGAVGEADAQPQVASRVGGAHLIDRRGGAADVLVAAAVVLPLIGQHRVEVDAVGVGDGVHAGGGQRASPRAAQREPHRAHGLMVAVGSGDHAARRARDPHRAVVRVLVANEHLDPRAHIVAAQRVARRCRAVPLIAAQPPEPQHHIISKPVVGPEPCGVQPQGVALIRRPDSRTRPWPGSGCTPASAHRGTAARTRRRDHRPRPRSASTPRRSTPREDRRLWWVSRNFLSSRSAAKRRIG